jgi:outer membrane protein assembly factor BamD (BamD/ComL family)
MSVTGIASSILSALSGTQTYQTRSQQIQSEFQQLGQDLQSGNLNQAQSDFATLTQNLPGLTQNSATTTASTNTNPIAAAFAQLGQDLQSGNLQGAQQDFTTLQQDLQQNVSQQVGGHHHHHHHAESSQGSSSSSSQTNSINQSFSQLAQTLQAGNLQGAQSAFSNLQSDLQAIGGFITSGSSNSGSTGASSAGSLNVTA